MIYWGIFILCMTCSKTIREFVLGELTCRQYWHTQTAHVQYEHHWLLNTAKYTVNTLSTQANCKAPLKCMFSELPKMSLLLFLLHFWHTPLAVRSAKRRHQSPEWMILSHVNCFIQGEVIGFQVLLDSLHPHSTRSSWWSPPVQQEGKLLRSSWHLFHLAFTQCGWTQTNAVLRQ